MKRCGGRLVKGSMTVEAVFVMSAVLLIILWVMKTAIGMYEQTVEAAGVQWLVIEKAADTFRKLVFAEALLP